MFVLEIVSLATKYMPSLTEEEKKWRKKIGHQPRKEVFNRHPQLGHTIHKTILHQIQTFVKEMDSLARK
jgi:hypothetical protein